MKRHGLPAVVLREVLIVVAVVVGYAVVPYVRRGELPAAGDLVLLCVVYAVVRAITLAWDRIPKRRRPEDEDQATDP